MKVILLQDTQIDRASQVAMLGIPSLHSSFMIPTTCSSCNPWTSSQGLFIVILYIIYTHICYILYILCYIIYIFIVYIYSIQMILFHLSWNLILSMMVLGCGTFGRCLRHAGRALMKVISTFINTRLHWAPFLLPPQKDITRSLWPGKGPSLNHAGTLISDPQSPEIVRNKLLLFISYLVFGISL